MKRENKEDLEQIFSNQISKRSSIKEIFQLKLFKDKSLIFLHQKKSIIIKLKYFLIYL